jgi:hypothetical protein
MPRALVLYSELVQKIFGSSSGDPAWVRSPSVTPVQSRCARR